MDKGTWQATVLGVSKSRTQLSMDACTYETRIHLQVFSVYLFSSSRILNSKCPMGNIYTHIHTHTHTHVYVCICVYIHICVYMFVYVYIYVCVCIYISNLHIVPFKLCNYICQLFISKVGKY